MSAGTSPPVLMTVPALPVDAFGTSVVVRRLVENLKPEEIILLGRAPDRRAQLSQDRLHVPAIRVRWLAGGWSGERYSQVVGVIPAVMQGVLAARAAHVGAVIAVYPDPCSLLSGYLLHRVMGLPLIAYFCDLYMEDRQGAGWEARLARWLQPRVFQAATRIIAVNQGMVEYYRSRYGIEALHLPACINHAIPEFEPAPTPGRVFRIAYSGNINDTRIDSIRALVAAVGEDPSMAIHYFTPQTPDYLRTLGVWSRNATAEFIADEEALIKRLMECDALFLPLTFETGAHSRDQMATCFGIKSYEYFLARRPILVHVPGDYFLARFYRQWDCGVVVDDPSPQALLAGLNRIRGNPDLRNSLVRQGLVAARQFEGPRIAAALRAEIAAVMSS